MRPSTLVKSVLATTPTLVTLVRADDQTSNAPYALTDDLSYHNFFNNFELFSDHDPTNGFVQYQNYTSAIEQNLIGYLPDTQSVFLGVDYQTKDPNGRASVRVESTKSWNQGLFIADIRHMPASIPGTWPALWLLSATQQWPNGGEVDILEGVNDYETNSITLHTSAGRSVANSTSTSTPGTTGSADPSQQQSFLGTLATSNCDVNAPGQGANVGCSIHAPATHSRTLQQTSASGQTVAVQDDEIFPTYGTNFNAVQGGVYATEWTSTSISVWFFPRNSVGYSTYFSPSSSSLSAPDPSRWGTPLAHFAGDECSFTQRFTDLKIIFDTTFCGEWAGKEWDLSMKAKTGVATCEQYVLQNPQAFAEAYWEIAGLRWYQRGGAAAVEPGGVKARGRHVRW